MLFLRSSICRLRSSNCAWLGPVDAREARPRAAPPRAAAGFRVDAALADFGVLLRVGSGGGGEIDRELAEVKRVIGTGFLALGRTEVVPTVEAPTRVFQSMYA